MNLFYTPGISGNLFHLSEEESGHLIRVLRNKKGDVVFLTNGTGDFMKAIIVDDNPKSCGIEITETKHEYGKKKYCLHVAIAPTKNIDRFEWFLEKATEIGIDEITPLICDHSERREIKTERLNKVIVSAMKQSVKAYLPKLNDAQSYRNFISSPAPSGKFICSTEASPDHLLENFYRKGNDVLILIGPEGDFSREEMQLASQNNFKVVSLGSSRLRTETAGMVACHAISMLNH
ncbi:MAG: 16S rRNA (uracil(1498)-N(3))-methyltransferase [Bacteroidetes bacterium]|nr:16S rRNA (uracil(1498)-N(3))-methyltransferase [Bacteroidota bacterium]